MSTDGQRTLFFKVADRAAPRGIVTGWAYVCTSDEGAQTVDASGHFILFEDLEEAFEEAFMPGAEHAGMGLLHIADGGARIMGQITLNRAERESLGFGPGPEGAIIKARILDPKLLELIRSGRVAALSIEGEATQTEVEVEDDAEVRTPVEDKA